MNLKKIFVTMIALAALIACTVAAQQLSLNQAVVMPADM